MGVMPVNRLLLTMSVPMMISMLVQALYNVVDSIFVSRLGEEALTAVSLAFPVQSLMIAVGAGTAVGINALLSRRLGEKNYDGVNRVAVNGVFLALVNGLVFLLFGILGVRFFFSVQTGDTTIIEHGANYLSICCMGSVSIFAQMTFERLLQGTGKTIYSMISQSCGAVTNIILDPILIFGLGGMPAMGTAGAAVATVLGQLVGLVVAIILNFRFNHEVKLHFRGYRPQWKTIRSIYGIGIPSILLQSIGSVMTFGMNRILLAFTPTAAAVFGVYFKLQSFIFMPIFGLNNGMVPIIAYNYGAKKRKRITDAIRLAIIYAEGIMLIGFLLFQLFPAQLLGLFNASEDMVRIGVPALRTISVHFLLAGYCIISGTVFQALGHAVLSLINSVTRQVVVLLPVAWLLAQTGTLDLVWWSFPIAEVASVILSTLFLIRVYQRVIKPIGLGPPAGKPPEAEETA